MMRTEAGAVARCERVQARKALIENEIMQCEGELRTLMAGFASGTPRPLKNRKIDAAIAILQRMQTPVPGINIAKPLQSNIPTLIASLQLIKETPGSTLSADHINTIHLSFRYLAEDLSELANPNPILASQLRPIIATLEYNITEDDTSVDYWVKVLNRIGMILASETDPTLSVPLVSEMGNSILREK